MESPHDARSGQRLGLCWGSVPGGTLLDVAQAASAADLAVIAVTPGQVLAALAGRSAAELRRQLRDFGVRVGTIDPLIGPVPGTPPPAEVEQRMRALFEAGYEDGWRAAEAVEAKAINFTQFLGRPRPLASLSEALARLARQNAAHGFASTFEFIPGTSVPDLPSAAALVRDAPGLTIMFDMWHFARSDGRIADIDALPPGTIGGVQINDWLPAAPGAPYVPMSGRLMPGDGCLPLAEILARIEANSPGLDVSIEVFNADLEAMGRDAAARLLAGKSRLFLAEDSR